MRGTIVADVTQSIGILQFALNATVAQQQVIANNISNLNTPNYQADKVSFESSLAHALQFGGAASANTFPEGLASATNGNNVSLPTETTLMMKNNLENQTLDHAISGQFAIISDALNA
ncbi:MAG: flagellar basal body protein [Actinomycetota bacterium]|jgi:flagellar basal-body rod protein FlgB|nr:flagellar basal body protein [Actinomycetota bacterium]